MILRGHASLDHFYKMLKEPSPEDICKVLVLSTRTLLRKLLTKFGNSASLVSDLKCFLIEYNGLEKPLLSNKVAFILNGLRP